MLHAAVETIKRPSIEHAPIEACSSGEENIVHMKHGACAPCSSGDEKFLFYDHLRYRR